MPQSRNPRSTVVTRWTVGAGLGLGAVGAAVLWCWERPLGLAHGPLFFAVVALTVLGAGAAVIALLRRIAADQRSGGTSPGRSTVDGSSSEGAAAMPQRPPEPLPGLLPELLLALALLVCGGLAALFFLLPTNDDDPWIPWVASALVFAALAFRPVRGYLRVRGPRRDRPGRTDGT